jgi:hypothetical protein
MNDLLMLRKKIGKRIPACRIAGRGVLRMCRHGRYPEPAAAGDPRTAAADSALRAWGTKFLENKYL